MISHAQNARHDEKTRPGKIGNWGLTATFEPPVNLGGRMNEPIFIPDNHKEEKSGIPLWTFIVIIILGGLVFAGVALWNLYLAPKWSLHYDTLGTALLDQGNYDQAIADFDTAIQLDPNDVAAYVHRGIAYYWKSDPVRANADFDKAIQTRPHADDPMDDYYHGMAYYNEARYDPAISDLDKAIQLRPDFADAYLFRGRAYYIKSQYDNAMADFDKYIELLPDEPYGYFDRGNLEISEKEKDQAIADYKKVVELGSDPYLKQQAEGILRTLNALTP
jgi:tetratricopeptide (TPR) repeat protein